MKNGKNEIVTLMSRAIGAVLITCACLLGASASGQVLEGEKVQGDTKIFISGEFGNGGRTEVTEKKTGPNAKTLTEVWKDPKGIEHARGVQTITPDQTYEKDGVKVVFTVKTDSGRLTRTKEADEEAGPVNMEGEYFIGYEGKGVIREEKVTFTYPAQGKRRTEIFRKRDSHGNKTDESITRTDANGEEVSFEESRSEDGKQVYGFKRYFDMYTNRKRSQRFNPETKEYEDVASKTNLLGGGISAPPTDTTANSDTFKHNEIVGGFSLIREDSDPEDFNTYGFFSSYTRHLNETVGLTGDFSANFRERGAVDLTKTSFTGGVTVLPFPGANGDDRIRVFTRALFGVAHFKADTGTFSFTDNAFTMKFGGGVDIKLNDHLFVRPVEADYAPTRFGGSWQHNVQVNFGLGLRF